MAAYLAAGAGPAALATTAGEAAIISIDVGPSGFNIGGINAGLAPGASRQLAFPNSNEYWLGLFNNYTESTGYFTILGLAMGPASGIAFTGGYVAPRNFGFGDVVDATANFTPEHLRSVFRVQWPGGTISAPDFGPDSYIGFRSSGGSYGWLEVTWDQVAAEFEILSGAYESEPDVGIRAGYVPEPASGPLAALVLGGAAFARWRAFRAATSPPAAPPAPNG